jgi:hypothetical protein
MTRFDNAATRRVALAALGAGIAVTAIGADASAAPDAKASLAKAAEDLRAAMVAGDGAALKRLLHDRLTYSHSDAHMQTKQQVLDELAGKHSFVSINQSNYIYDIVEGTGIVRFVFDGVNNTPDGKTSSSHIFVLQAWVRAGSSWKLLARASTPLKV